MGYRRTNEREIIVAARFDRESQPVFDAAARMARSRNAQLWLLQVDDEARFRDEPRRGSSIHSPRSRWLKSYLHEARQLGISARPLQSPGRPSEVIVAVAEGLDAELVVLGDSRWERPRWLTASTTLTVIRASRCPVLTVSTKAHVAAPLEATGFKHLLFPTDFSEESRAALPVAASLAEFLTARLTLVNVRPPPIFLPVWPEHREPNNIDGTHRPPRDSEPADALSDALLCALDRLPPSRVDTSVVVDRDAARGIAHAADRGHVDLIAIPRHRRHSISTLFFGHTAERLSRIGPAPVLIYTAPDSQTGATEFVPASAAMSRPLDLPGFGQR